ncbi:MAG: hypothetical protein ACREVA_01190 [Burkholderiales bacterium]
MIRELLTNHAVIESICRHVIANNTIVILEARQVGIPSWKLQAIFTAFRQKFSRRYRLRRLELFEIMEMVRFTRIQYPKDVFLIQPNNRYYLKKKIDKAWTPEPVTLDEILLKSGFIMTKPR